MRSPTYLVLGTRLSYHREPDRHQKEKKKQRKYSPCYAVKKAISPTICESFIIVRQDFGTDITFMDTNTKASECEAPLYEAIVACLTAGSGGIKE